MDPTPFLDVATAAAREAGSFLRERFGQPHEVAFKGSVDMVTEADRGAEALIATRIRRAFPNHALLAEEGTHGDPVVSADARYRWVVDPLDGTTNFAHALPHFAVSIALEDEQGPLIGVVYDPLREELFAASRGLGARLNGTPLRISATSDLLQSLLATGFSYDLARRQEQALVWRALLSRVQGIRQTGSSALNLAYVAAGRLDGYWERGLAAWDAAAGILLVAEAGGLVTGSLGARFRAEERDLVASNGRLHPQLLAVIGDAESS